MAVSNNTRAGSNVRKKLEDYGDDTDDPIRYRGSMDRAAEASRYVHYFMVCGLDLNFGLEPDEANSSLEQQLIQEYNPLERSYKPRILQHYPDITQWSHFNPDALSRLCLPQGLKFCTQSEKENFSPSCHPFILTKEDGSKSCGFSLVYMEEVKDMNICHALHTLQKMYSTEAECGTLKKSDRIRPSSATRPNNVRSRSLPRHYSTRLSGSSLDLSSAKYDFRKDTLYVTKSISIICSQPFVTTSTQVLNSICKFISRNDYDIHILEGFIYNLLYDIPVPSPGRSIRFWCLGNEASISLPKEPDELPVFDYPLLDFFEILGIENSLKLLTCVLLEHQILVFSSDCQKLMLICECVLALIYPFQWSHVYVPILPPMLENFLDAPVPYIMGLVRSNHDINIYNRASVCIVDIDNNELELPEELPEFPYENELCEELQSMIVKYGGTEGATMLKSQATEQLELLNDNHVIDSTVERLNQMIQQFENIGTNSGKSNKHSLKDKMILNTVLREVFVNRFGHMFHSYEHFVIINDEQDLNLTPQSDTPQNFDKISFLSDQIQSHLPFLSRFLETQSFSNFIDEHIQTITEGVYHETSFDIRLSNLKSKYGENLVRTPTYERCENYESKIEQLKYRCQKVELTVSPQKSNRKSPSQRQVTRGIFPSLDSSLFEKRQPDNSSTAVFIKGDRRSKLLDVNLVPTQKISMLSPSQASIAETNWKFVNQLLKETKQKTKRILLEKLGMEAVEWGHGQIGFSVTEENMLVGSLCDLIERIWAHGLQTRHKKSAFWSFLYKYSRHNERATKAKGKLGGQAFCVPLITSKPYLLPDHARSVQVTVIPLCKDRSRNDVFDSNIMSIMHNVTTIHEIKTEIGYSRAWIRLALEQKVLASHLATMIKDLPLLRSLYKRYAYLRCEDEKEQTLYYLQTLNAVDFSCFTNAYTQSFILYQVLIFPSQRSGSSLSSANIWMHLVGSHSETDYLQVPRGVIHFSFWAKNLGVITSLRIGHDNSGLTPNWMVEHVLVKNEFTGHCYKFNCGRWLGKNIDDGSVERYLVGTMVPGIPGYEETQELVKECASPPAYTCPSLSIRSTGPMPEDVEIQTLLSESINRIIKHHHKSLKERVSWAQLMCGELGLVHSLIQVFSYGYKSARLFGKNLSVWDFLLKVVFDFNQSQLVGSGSATNSPTHSPRKANPSERASSTVPRTTQLRRMYTRLITRIETTCQRLGKDDKFQLFVCLAVHDRLLQRIVTDLTRAVAAIQLYEEQSFLRDSELAGYVTHILEALTTIEVPVDPAMKKSLEQL